MNPETLVQRQLDAYNARDIDALVTTYADDAEQFEHPATLLAKGSGQLRERFAGRFKEANLHAALLHRIGTHAGISPPRTRSSRSGRHGVRSYLLPLAR